MLMLGQLLARLAPTVLQHETKKLVRKDGIEPSPGLAEYGFTVRCNLSQYLPLTHKTGAGYRERSDLNSLEGYGTATIPIPLKTGKPYGLRSHLLRLKA